MDHQSSSQFDRYTAADLSPQLLERIRTLEVEMRQEMQREVILIAYEDRME